MPVIPSQDSDRSPPAPTTAPSSEQSGYLTLFELASGGMGRVDLAMRRSGGFERLYAIKRLKAEVADDPDCQRMFFAEARLAGLIRHPNVVSVLDVGADERGPFLVMDWVDGISLRRFIRDARSRGPVSVALACRLVAAAARGLAASHVLYAPDGSRIELVHRDVSPHNILLSFDGTVRVTDFGIAKALGPGPGTESLVVKGKLPYMSPEQLRFRSLDHRSDLYALGVVLFETLTGARPFEPTTGGELESFVSDVLEGTPPGVGELRRDVPPELEDLIYGLLAKEPDDRPATAREVATRLEEIAAELDDGESLEALLAERFGEERAAMRKRIAEATGEVSHSPSRSQAWRPGRAPSRVGLWIFALALALGATGTALALVLLRDVEPTPTIGAPGVQSPRDAADARAERGSEPAPLGSGERDDPGDSSEAEPRAGAGEGVEAQPPEPTDLGEPPNDESSATQEGPAAPHAAAMRRRTARRRGRTPTMMADVPSQGQGGWN